MKFKENKMVEPRAIVIPIEKVKSWLNALAKIDKSQVEGSPVKQIVLDALRWVEEILADVEKEMGEEAFVALWKEAVERASALEARSTNLIEEGKD
jgi:hypothetical protein